jgi:hypothetical protein
LRDGVLLSFCLRLLVLQHTVHPVATIGYRLVLRAYKNSLRGPRHFQWQHSISLGEKPFQAPEPVAAYLQKQALDSQMGSFSPLTGFLPEFRTVDRPRLSSFTFDHSSDNDADARCPRTPSLLSEVPLLILGLEPPAHLGPIDPPTPAESIQSSRSDYRSRQEPTVQVTKQI